jgi:hypothetical protein
VNLKGVEFCDEDIEHLINEISNSVDAIGPKQIKGGDKIIIRRINGQQRQQHRQQT